MPPHWGASSPPEHIAAAVPTPLISQGREIRAVARSCSPGSGIAQAWSDDSAWIGELLRAAGVDDVVTVDLHSRTAHHLFPVPLRSLSPAEIFAGEITRLSLAGATVVAPDEGALDRCEAVRQATGIDRPVAYFEKTRTAAGITHSGLHGTVGRHVVIVDDILDTGGTLISSCEALRREYLAPRGAG